MGSKLCSTAESMNSVVRASFLPLFSWVKKMHSPAAVEASNVKVLLRELCAQRTSVTWNILAYARNTLHLRAKSWASFSSWNSFKGGNRRLKPSVTTTTSVQKGALIILGKIEHILGISQHLAQSHLWFTIASVIFFQEALYPIRTLNQARATFGVPLTLSISWKEEVKRLKVHVWI